MNFSQFTTEQIQKYIRDCNDKILQLSPQSPMFDQICLFKSYAEQELSERYFIERYVESQANVTKTINIGITEDSVKTPDYNTDIIVDCTVTRSDK